MWLSRSRSSIQVLIVAVLDCRGVIKEKKLAKIEYQQAIAENKKVGSIQSVLHPWNATALTPVARMAHLRGLYVLVRRL